jgi:hypothetical protein
MALLSFSYPVVTAGIGLIQAAEGVWLLRKVKISVWNIALGFVEVGWAVASVVVAVSDPTTPTWLPSMYVVLILALIVSTLPVQNRLWKDAVDKRVLPEYPRWTYMMNVVFGVLIASAAAYVAVKA